MYICLRIINPLSIAATVQDSNKVHLLGTGHVTAPHRTTAQQQLRAREPLLAGAGLTLAESSVIGYSK